MPANNVYRLKLVCGVAGSEARVTFFKLQLNYASTIHVQSVIQKVPRLLKISLIDNGCNI